VQPGGHGRIAAEAAGPAEGRDQRVLQGVGSVLRIRERPQRYRPEPVAVAQEELAEGVRITFNVPSEQLRIG